jgi:diguanylate cyclase
MDVSELVRRERAVTALNQRLEQVNAELERLSNTDPLTGLGNRRQFDRRLAEECARAARHCTPLALLVLDVDHFKRFNDLYGHPAGDARLTQLARVLEQSARRPGDLLARIGGEEFALLLPHLDPSAAMDQAQRIQQALAEASPRQDQPPPGEALTVSIGVAVWPGSRGEDGLLLRPADLLAQADAAMYEAKRRGRARSVLHGDASA